MGRPPKTSALEIVDAALELIGTRGFQRATIAAIASRVGITDGGVLHHFPSKDALIAAVVDRELELQISRFRELAKPGGLEALRRLSEWGAVNEASPELVRLQITMSADAILDESTVHEYIVNRYTSIQAAVVGLIEQGIERGEIDPDVDAEWEASALIAYLDGIRLQWFYSGRALPLRDHVKRYFEALVARLAAAPPRA